ncbi:type VI secretion system protein TssA (plasmid) [Caballeronia sp. NK8]|uniref:type VI secretion system protein TssA n=1 Tax=Caballeronia sp. NK8 TaxID=140098 RepID=UPI001BB6E0B2|nr:type VI secretion system ImpA family N-terminal domain-containing protein [Caballeronia sp. NK8]BCQ27637.1 type VI secretion system protein TssA [Caballeronia sp. NK8]
MSKKRIAKTEQNPSHDWMTPVNPSAPCGADLEYDPEFVVLFAQVAAKMDAQYGDFVGVPEPINWSEIDRDCRRLMMRSKDMRLALLFTRCRTRLAYADGLAEGLGLLAAWLTTFADSIHPQPGVDDDRDAALEIRMNALQALTDMDGLMADVRDISLTRASVRRLQVRDVERAFAQPRPSDALSIESVTQQLQDLRLQQPDAIAGFDRALDSLGVIDAWNQAQLGAFAADLSTLTRMLKRVAGEGPAPASSARAGSAPFAEEPADASTDNADEHDDALAEPSQAVETRVTMKSRPGRESALHSIREARQWFETHEPSSPIPVLLKRAEQFVGKRYAETVKAIPAELIIEWDKEE